jgi:hypothetical protein
MGAIGGKVKGGFQQDGGRAAQNPPDSAFCDIAGRVSVVCRIFLIK